MVMLGYWSDPAAIDPAGWMHTGDLAVMDDELRAACHGRVATFKILRYWKFVDSFPMTVTGKVQKFRMREIAAAERACAAPTASSGGDVSPPTRRCAATSPSRGEVKAIL